MLWHKAQGAGGVGGEAVYPAVDFDGNDALRRAGSAAANVLNNPFTVECWFNLKGNSPLYAGSIRNASLYSQGEGDVNRFSLEVRGDSSTTGIGFELYSGPSDKKVVWDVGVLKNAWHHVAAVRQSTGGNVDLYLNGVKLTPSSDTLGGGALSNGTPTFANIGRLNYPNYEFYFVGEISNLRFTPGTGVYSTNFKPAIPLTNLPNTLYRMCASDISVTDDLSANNLDFTVVGNPTLTSTTPL